MTDCASHNELIKAEIFARVESLQKIKMQLSVVDVKC